MVFSSIIFLLGFLPLLLFLYTLSDKRYKNAILLIASAFFYSWGAPKFIFVIFLTTMLDFFLVRFMGNSKDERSRKALLVVSVSINLGLLFYFKYCNFFIENVNFVLHAFGVTELRGLNVILPIGISFYTFETITYVVDVYRKVHKPLERFWDYQLYILFFPKLIAGPIIRYHELADQINGRFQSHVNEDLLMGFYRFIIGLAKKVLIANQMALIADNAFGSNYATIPTYYAWIGSFAYTFQIYFDFSGYSDMALGLARMFGFRLPENFNNPYVSQSVTEFWRRWHISLGNWMRNYLYIPLGGNKGSYTRTYLNLWLVFLLSGLWHGASWGFVFWGVFHGAFLVLERFGLLKLYSKLGKWTSIAIIFFIVNIGWVFFRVEELPKAMEFISHMFGYYPGFADQISREFVFYLILAVVFSFFTITKLTDRIHHQFFYGEYSSSGHILVFCSCVLLFVLSVASITGSGFNPFIYFRF